MKLDTVIFRQLRRLAPTLEDILSSGEIEHADQALNLASLSTLCSQLSSTYQHLHLDDTDQACVHIDSCSRNS
jgi:hypothetical protein